MSHAHRRATLTPPLAASYGRPDPANRARTADVAIESGFPELPAADAAERAPARSAAAEERLTTLLRVLFVGLSAAGVVYALGPIVGPARSFFHEPVFVSNSVVKVTVLASCCLYAAGDVRGRRALVRVVVAAHVVSVAAMGLMLLFADTGRVVDVGPLTATVGTVLWCAIGLDAAITACLVAFRLAVPEEPGAANAGPAVGAPGPAERRLRVVLTVAAGLFAAAAAGYAAGPLIASTRDLFVELPFVTNSVVKAAALAMTCALVLRDPGRYLTLTGVVAGVHVLSVAVQVLFALALDTSSTRSLAGLDVSMTALLLGAAALDAAIAALLFATYRAAWRERHGLRFLHPIQHRALVAGADVVLAGRDERVPAKDIAANMDRSIATMRARRLWVYRVALTAVQLHPLLTAKPPLSELEPHRRRKHLVDHFERLGRGPEPYTRAVQAAIRVLQQLAYAGYYNDDRSRATTGYRPFSDRVNPLPPVRDPRLRVERGPELDAAALEADVCVVGSGAAGSVLAHELAARGRDVLVLEGGDYVPPSEMTEDEVDMIARLYADGIMQQTQDFRFTVLQGKCVGGSTTVNNAVSFPPPPAVLRAWNDPELYDAGLDLDGVNESVGAVRALVDVHEQPRQILNPSGVLYERGVRELGLSADVLRTGVVEANIRDCLGCGYCNIGCRFGAKLSMTETLLPRAQEAGPGTVRILAETEVDRVRWRTGEPDRVAGLGARTRDGRPLTVTARTYVIAGGAIASSYLLLRSGIGRRPGRRLPVGEHLAFNMGAPLTAEFPQALHAERGLQISHYGLPGRLNGFAFETWWNPPVAQALNMPGWFERHFENMSRYGHLMAVGALVGTAGNARVRRALTGGPDIAYVPSPADLRTLAKALRLLGEILFAAGATRVMANTYGYDEFTRPEQLARLDRIAMDHRYITLGSGHPQGGNALSRDPGKGVVDPSFRVHGFSNLYVCDASVFPSSLTVNPQITVMALAHHAAKAIE
jgi:choline dehydrogenase-like flavoprotein